MSGWGIFPGKDPLTGSGNLLKNRELVVEGERMVPDPAVRHGTVKEFKYAAPGKVLPRLGAEPVKEIEIDMARGEPGELFVQVPAHVLPAGEKPARDLGGMEESRDKKGRTTGQGNRYFLSAHDIAYVQITGVNTINIVSLSHRIVV
jgi:hypothetical protein